MLLRSCVNLLISDQCVCSPNSTSGLLTPPSVATLENFAAGRTIKTDRQGPTGWYKKTVAAGQQVSLRCELFSICILFTDAVIFPDNGSIIGMNGTQINVFMRKYAGTEIYYVFIDEHASADWPAGNHFAAAKKFFVVWSAAYFPD